jgi:hypothetical protein
MGRRKANETPTEPDDDKRARKELSQRDSILYTVIFLWPPEACIKGSLPSLSLRTIQERWICGGAKNREDVGLYRVMRYVKRPISPLLLCFERDAVPNSVDTGPKLAHIRLAHLLHVVQRSVGRERASAVPMFCGAI